MDARFAACALALLAGCATAPSPAPGPADGPLAFEAPVVAAAECPPLRGIDCFEPTIAADRLGRLFMATTRSGMARSLDLGRTFEAFDVPLPPGVPAGTFRGDDTFQTDPQGRLFFSSLLRTRDAPLGNLLSGLQVGRSDDGGLTWPVNVHLSLFESPGPDQLVVGTDRQWLGLGPGDTVYAVYWQFAPPVGIWAARSDDGGATWGRFVRAVPAEERPGGAIVGPPIVLDDGRLLVPHGGPAEATQTVPAFGFPSVSVRVSVSDDGGATFRQVVAHPAGDTGMLGPWPVLALDDATMSLHLAWNAADRGTYVASSTDRGESWGAPVRWNPDDGAATAAPPFLLVRGGVLQLAWYEAEGDRQRLFFARGAAPEAAERLPVADIPGAAPTTDFTHFASLPDGRAAVAWTHPDDGVYVAMQR